MTGDQQNNASLKGATLLLVEDDLFTGALFAGLLREFGCEVIGPVPDLKKAANLAGGAAIDVALLDLNVNGEVVYPVAEVLAARQIPFVFLTGYGAGSLQEAYRERPVLQKPVRPEPLKETLVRLLNPGSAAGTSR